MANFTCANQRFCTVIIQHLDEHYGANKWAYKYLLEQCWGLLHSTMTTLFIFLSPQFVVNHANAREVFIQCSHHTTLRLVALEEVHIHIQHGKLFCSKIQHFYYIDQVLATKNIPFISTRTSNRFCWCVYSLTDELENYSRDRHVLIISSNNSTSIIAVEPSFRHITSSVNEFKSNNSSKNADAIIAMLRLRVAVYYGGGTNDNASDA